MGLPPEHLSDSVRFSAIMKDINLLREDVNHLKKDIRVLHSQSQSSIVPNTCHVKLLLFDSAILPSTNAEVSNLLGCVVVNITRVSRLSFKVNIPRSCLFDALQSSAPNSYNVHIWNNHVSNVPATVHSPMQLSPARKKSICVASWNCCGFHNSIPYIQELLSSEDVDFLVLQEHWLWPFQLNQLGSIDKNYCHTAVCDKRLSPTSDLIRGCGETVILWKRCPSPPPLLFSVCICLVLINPTEFTHPM